MSLPILPAALLNLFRKPSTFRYPKKKPELPERSRQKLIFHKDKCIRCSLCAKVCPTGACTFDSRKKYPSFDLGLCISCGVCADRCPGKAIIMSHDFESATLSKKKLMLKP